MKNFRIYWIDGKTEMVEGNTFADAFSKAGYSRGAHIVMDFYTDGDALDYAYDKERQIWDRIVPLSDKAFLNIALGISR
jgi:hypothetical protein